MIALVAVSLPLAACSKKKETPQPAALPTEGAPKSALAAVAPGADPLPNALALPPDQVVETKLGDAVVLVPKRPKAEVGEGDTSFKVSGLFSEPIEISEVDGLFGSKAAALAEEDAKLKQEVSQFDGPGRYLSISARENGWRFVVTTVAIDDEHMLRCDFNAAVSADEARQVLDFCKAVGVKRAARAAAPGTPKTFELSGVKFSLPVPAGVTAEVVSDSIQVAGVTKGEMEIRISGSVVTDKADGEEAFRTNSPVRSEMLGKGNYLLLDKLGETEFKAALMLQVDDGHSVGCTAEHIGSQMAAERVLAFCQGIALVK